MFYESRNVGDSEYLRMDTENNLSFPRHIHNSFEIMLVTKGAIDARVDSDVYTLREGDGLFIFPYQIHSHSSVHSDHITFVFSPLLVSAYMTKLKNKVPVNGKFRLPEYLKDALCALSPSSSVTEKKGTLYSVCAFFDKTAEYTERGSGKDSLSRIFEYIEKNYASECTLKNTAENTGMNYSYVSRVFKELSGMNFNNYVNLMRLNRACYLMENTDYSVTECALESGFGSTHTFNRNFRKRYGTSPDKYRKKTKEEGKMRWNSEIEKLTGSGYDKKIVEEMKALERMFDDNERLSKEFDDILDGYTEKAELSIDETICRLSELSEKYGVNEYSLDLLLVINGLPYIHEKFREKGLSDEVFYETMDDIRCKINECVECKGVVGTFVLGWYDRFFKAECFGFGRFQYETAVYDLPDHKMSCGKVIKKGDIFINMHIPSRGIPLTDGVRYDSYKKAYEYFAPRFDDGIVIFGCHSWLLYDKHLEFLPENSNIRKFLSDFELISTKEHDDFDDKWRIFGRYADLPDSELPRDTSLRAAYADWLTGGHRSGSGFGLFLFDGNKILK